MITLMNTTLSVLELLEMHINYEVKSCINGTWQYLRTIGKEVILLCERDKRAGLPFDIYKNLAFIICFSIYNGKVSTSA